MSPRCLLFESLVVFVKQLMACLLLLCILVRNRMRSCALRYRAC